MSSSPRVLSEIIERLSDEIDHAREKHPGGDRFVALTCEFLELTRAIQDGESKANIRQEALQVACTAIRLVEESLDGHNH